MGLNLPSILRANPTLNVQDRANVLDNHSMIFRVIKETSHRFTSLIVLLCVMLFLPDMSFSRISPSSSSATDASFDAVIGCIEDIIMGIVFASLLTMVDNVFSLFSFEPLFVLYLLMLHGVPQTWALNENVC